MDSQCATRCAAGTTVTQSPSIRNHPLMAENARTGFFWENFMKSPEAIRGMQRAGFKRYQPVDKPGTGLPPTAGSPGNPAADRSQS
jgi:hypothetical protein